jgi:hypothetical protein
VRLLPLALALALPGCILDTEPCARGFVERGGRCLPAVAPPPFGGAADAGPDAAAEDDGWSRYTAVLVRDLTPAADVERAPTRPGADLDAVVALGADGASIGNAGAVREAVIGDAGGRSVAPKAEAALGPPDAGPASGFVSLGGEGHGVLLDLRLSRPLRAGDALRVYEVLADGPEPDRYEVLLCAPGADDPLADCRSLGQGSGVADIPLSP